MFGFRGGAKSPLALAVLVNDLIIIQADGGGGGSLSAHEGRNSFWSAAAAEGNVRVIIGMKR